MRNTALPGADAGHKIAVLVKRRVLQRQRILNLMAYVDPALRPDRDHLPVR